jgi:murein L,D-transpeptidase YafK
MGLLKTFSLMNTSRSIPMVLLMVLQFVLLSPLIGQNSFGGISSLGSPSSFIDYQKSLSRAARAFTNKESLLKKQFEEKNLSWPLKYMYIRSFKYDSELQVWVRNSLSDTFTLFKTYKVCALAGTMGPKRMEGDYQVPEGFYYINEFNANSMYHLSLGLNYPNPADKVLSDSMRPGGEIYIHGSCVTVGCIPVTDPQIEELYVLSSYARAAGQDFLPVHIFPVKFREPGSAAYLEELFETDNGLRSFATNLRKVYDFFEEHKRLPVVAVLPKGDYVFY